MNQFFSLIFVYNFFSTQIKTSENASAKYQDNKEKLKNKQTNKLVKDIKAFLKK